ncbi:MAG: hypothetical protein ACUVXB_04315 [Bryobacteraceae bacterium]
MAGRLRRTMGIPWLTVRPLLASDFTMVDGSGRTVGMVHDGEELSIRTSLYLPTPGWQTTYTQPTADRVTQTRSDSVTAYQGSIDMDSSRRLLFTQTVRQEGAAAVITLDYTASGTLSAEGLLFRLDVPWRSSRAALPSILEPTAPPSCPRCILPMPILWAPRPPAPRSAMQHRTGSWPPSWTAPIS